MFTTEERTVTKMALQEALASYEERFAWANALEDGYIDKFGYSKDYWVEMTGWQLAAVKSALEKINSIMR